MLYAKELNPSAKQELQRPILLCKYLILSDDAKIISDCWLLPTI